MTSPGMIAGRPFVCSWSGGKDCCLALQEAAAAGGVPAALLCMLDESGSRTRSHGLPLSVVQAQAAALGLPLTVRSASWSKYEAAFIDALTALAAGGVEAAVFGDLDLEEHRLWEETVCGRAGLLPFLPLWGRPRVAVLDALFAQGILATVVTVQAGALAPEFVGRTLTPASVKEIESAGADPAGELGEYHTLVTDCPLFAHPLPVHVAGRVRRDDHWFARLVVEDDEKEATT